MIDSFAVYVAGARARMVFALFDGAGERTPEADLSAATAVVTVRKLSTAVSDAELQRHAATIDATAGTVTLELTSLETDLLAPDEPSMAAQCEAQVRVETGSTSVVYQRHRFEMAAPLTISSSAIPVPTPTTWTNYVGVKDGAGDFTEADLARFGDHAAIALPAYTEGRRLGVATPVAQNDLTAIFLYASGSRNTHNQITAFDRQTATVTLAGVECKVWATVDAQTGFSGYILEARQ